MENSVLRGSCMCGKVRFELRGSGCGSPIYSHGENRKHIVSVRCGTLDGDLPLLPSVHAFVASKANWIEITDDLPQHAEYFA